VDDTNSGSGNRSYQAFITTPNTIASSNVVTVNWSSPTPSPTPVPLMGNVADNAQRSIGGTANVVDGSLSSEWVGTHKFTLVFSWSQPVTIHRIVVWDRSQNSPDNNQINKIAINLSNGVSWNLDMESGGRRCVNLTFGDQTVTSVTIHPDDASGNNGLKEVEIWAVDGNQSSGNSCTNNK
jgi:hypothetical protein